MRQIETKEIKVGQFYAVLNAQTYKGFINEIIEIISIDEPFMLVRCKTGVCGITGDDRKPTLTKFDEFVLAEPNPDFVTAALGVESWDEVIEETL